jgi:hypothetical protein
MSVLRAIVLLMLLAAGVLFLLYTVTGQTRYKKLGLIVLKWTLLAGFGFFAMLIFQRVT